MEQHTLAELVQVYTQEYLPWKAPKTAYGQDKLLRRMLAHFGDCPLAELTAPCLRLWKEALLAHYKPGTVRGYLEVLSGALRAAVEDYEWLETNPLAKVKRPKPARMRIRFLSEDERPRLLAACQQSASPALYTIVLLALASGARKMEVLGLRWHEVDMQAHVIRLPQTKNGRGRVVPIPPLVIDALAVWGETRRQRIDWVFPSVNGTQPASIATAWATAVTRAEVPNFRFHDLRHTAASYLAMSGASVREIAELLGHSTITMASQYIHLTTNHMAAVVERMSDKFLV